MKKYLVNLAFLLVAVPLGLVAVEMGLRLLFPQSLGVWYKTRDDLVILRPNYEGIARGVETVQRIRTNSWGMRDREHQLQKEPGTFRILLLGDSHMEALQVTFEQSFPKLLADKLSESMNYPVEVINASASGRGTDEHLTYFKRYGFQFSPDLILVAMSLHNDIYDNLEQNFHALNENGLVERPVQLTPLVSYKIWQAKAFLGAHLHSYQLLRMWWHSRDMKQDGLQLNSHLADLVLSEPNSRLAKGWRLTKELFKQLKAEGHRINAETAVFMMPLHIQLNQVRLSEFLISRGLTKDAVLLHKPQQMMKEFADAEGIAIVDLLPGFLEWKRKTGSELYLRLDGHMTVEGHQVAAGLVSQALIDKGLLRKSHAGVSIGIQGRLLKTGPNQDP